MMIELLAPAGDFECAKIALYSGCDAIYCATSLFGARAYAQNLNFEELEKILKLAHSLNKKVYVTVNTIIKESELQESINYVNYLYTIGVDGMILADYALIAYVIKNLPLMEAHISTQAGVKDLNDTLYFEKLGAKRVVLARENSIEEIANIKRNSKIELEVFAHGALCVSYSGGCLLSSYLSLRSGNRGRCSQNCRRLYSLYRDDTLLGKEAYFLSMKDLNISAYLPELIKLGVASLKLEGRMKNKEYVKVITSEYRKKITDSFYEPKSLESIFHRPYTKGFIFGENNGFIVDENKKSNEGKLIGEIIGKKGKLTACKLIDTILIKDRIRLELNDADYYFSIDNIYDANNKSVNVGKNIIYLDIFKEIPIHTKIYKMIDSSLDTTVDNQYKLGITIMVTGTAGKPLKLKCAILNKNYEVASDVNLIEALNKPLDEDILTKQLGKLSETSFYLKNVLNDLNGKVFMTIAEINNTRRKLISLIENDLQGKRKLPTITENSFLISSTPETELVAFCNTLEQYQACVDSGIKTIYYKNYSPYVNAKYEDIKADYVLVGDYGGIYKYQGDKELISDYSFNAINSLAVYYLHQAGIKFVTLGLEASFKDLKDIYAGYKKYGNNPNLEYIVYGRATLMTMKYCPLKRYNECLNCNKHQYFIADEQAKFPIIHKDCYTQILNSRPLNLIDELKDIAKYAARLRLQFTTESYNEALKIIKSFQNKLNNLDEKSNYFNSSKYTRGYFKRHII